MHVALTEVMSPAAPRPHVLVAFNTPSLAKFGPSVRPGGLVIYDSSVINGQIDGLAAGVRTVAVPFTGVAAELGAALVKNVVALRCLARSDEGLSGRDLPHRHPSHVEAKVRHDSDQRRGIQVGSQARRRAGLLVATLSSPDPIQRAELRRQSGRAVRFMS